MLAGAVADRLKAQGMSPVYALQFADYTATGPPAVAVYAMPDADAELDSGAYDARIQIRGRGPNAIAAENIARTAMAHLQAAENVSLPWTDPTGGPSRTYKLEAIRVVTRPTWYATPEPGEEVSANVRLHVTET